MANLHARVLSLMLVSGFMISAPLYADGSTLPTFSSGQNAFGNSQSGRIVSASSGYLVLDWSDESSDGRVWDIQNSQFLDLKAANDSHGASSYASAAAVSGNVVVGVRGSSVYQWTLGSSVTGSILGATSDSGASGVSGSTVAGYTTYSYVVELPGGPSYEFTPTNATYWDSNGAHVLPTGTDRMGNSAATAVSGNKVAGWIDNGNDHNAVVWTVNTSNYTSTKRVLWSASSSEAVAVSGNLVAGFVEYEHDEGMRSHATVWKIPTSTDDAVTQIDLHPADTESKTYYRSDVLAVESDVRIGDVIYDIVVGSVNIDDVTTAALWLLGDGLGDAEHPYEFITLSNDFGEDLKNTYATAIVVEDGQLKAIYGFGERSDDQGYIPLVWSPTGIGAEVPEPMAVTILLTGACGLMLRRPRRA